MLSKQLDAKIIIKEQKTDMLDNLQVYVQELGEREKENSLMAVYVGELGKQDRMRREFAKLVLALDEEVDCPVAWQQLFNVGFQAGYTRDEVVVLAGLGEYEKLLYQSSVTRSDESWIRLFRTVDAYEVEALAVWRELLLIAGVLKLQVDAVRWYKERYETAMKRRDEARKLFRDAVDASLFTPEELMEYISSKMTVIPRRLLSQSARAEVNTVDTVIEVTEDEDDWDTETDDD